MEQAPRHLHERLQRLQESLHSCQAGLAAQQEAAQTLRLKVAKFRQESAELSQRAERAQLRLINVGSATEGSGPSLDTQREARPQNKPQARKHGSNTLPFLLLIAIGVGYGLQSSELTMPQAEAASAPRYQQPPAPIPVIEAPPVASAQSVTEAEIDESGEALRLVYESQAPGSKASVLELLGATETSASRSPWEVDRFDESGYVVTYRTPDGTAAYEFETDTASGLVKPSAETAQRLIALAHPR